MGHHVLVVLNFPSEWDLSRLVILFEPHEAGNVYLWQSKKGRVHGAFIEFPSLAARRSAIAAFTGYAVAPEMILQVYEMPKKSKECYCYYAAKEQADAPLESQDEEQWLSYLVESVKTRGGALTSSMFAGSPAVRRAISAKFVSVDAFLHMAATKGLVVVHGTEGKQTIRCVAQPKKKVEVGTLAERVYLQGNVVLWEGAPLPQDEVLKLRSLRINGVLAFLLTFSL